MSNNLDRMCEAHHKARSEQGFTTAPWNQLEERNREQYRQAMKAALNVGYDPVAPYPSRAERDWPEDSGHENGNYYNICHPCGRSFTGHKRRLVCRACATGVTIAHRALLHDHIKRAMFEAHCRKTEGWKEFERGSDGQYLYIEKQEMWEWWDAAWNAYASLTGRVSVAPDANEAATPADPASQLGAHIVNGQVSSPLLGDGGQIKLDEVPASIAVTVGVDAMPAGDQVADGVQDSGHSDIKADPNA